MLHADCMNDGAERIMKRRIEKYFEEHRDEFLEDIMKLIRVPSINGPEKPGMPFGEENARVLELAKKMAEGYGLKAETLENRVTVIDLNEKPAGLDILAHLDVVPAGSGWTVTAPFEPVIQNGKLYGRGSSDDKGPAAAALYALRAIKELNIPVKKNVRLILGADEETACRDTAYYYDRFDEAPCSFSPDAEFPLINIEKGGLYTKYSATWEEDQSLPRIERFCGGTAGNVVPNQAEAIVLGLSRPVIQKAAAEAEKETGIQFCIVPGEFKNTEDLENVWKIEATGQSTHASTPWEGKNAVTGLLSLLIALPLSDSKGLQVLRGLAEIFPYGDYYGAAAGIRQEDKISGFLTLGTNMIDYHVNGLMGKIDCRAPLCASKETVLDVLSEKLTAAGIEIDPDSRMTPPHHVPEESPFIQTLLACYEEVMGEKGSCMAIGGGTYAHHLKNGVAFGCMKLGTDYHMHGADEFLIVDEIIKSAELFTLAIARICEE